jgi:hypothetical protein
MWREVIDIDITRKCNEPISYHDIQEIIGITCAANQVVVNISIEENGDCPKEDVIQLISPKKIHF